MFQRSDIENHPDIIKVDSDKELDLFCYKNYNSESDPVVQQSRGVIYNKNNLVMKSFGFIIECTSNDESKVGSYINNMDDFNFYPSFEGTLIRVFYHNKWYISTNRKLNAFNSKWSSDTSFGNLFCQALESEYNCNDVFKEKLNLYTGNSVLDKFLSSLDKENKYFFLLKTNENTRIVSKPPSRPSFYYVGHYSREEPVHLDTHASSNLYLPRLFKIPFTTVSGLLNYVNSCNPLFSQGLIAINYKTNVHYKIYNPRYKELYDLRGNQPNIIIRFLQILKGKEGEDLNKFKFMYPEYELEFNQYERTLNELKHYIYNCYVTRYMKRQFLQLPPEQHYLVKLCHNWYHTNGRKEKVTLTKINEILNQQDEFYILKLLKNFKRQV